MQSALSFTLGATLVRRQDGRAIDVVLGVDGATGIAVEPSAVGAKSEQEAERRIHGRRVAEGGRCAKRGVVGGVLAPDFRPGF